MLSSQKLCKRKFRCFTQKNKWLWTGGKKKSRVLQEVKDKPVKKFGSMMGQVVGGKRDSPHVGRRGRKPTTLT